MIISFLLLKRNDKVRVMVWNLWNFFPKSLKPKCAVPEYIHTSPTEEIISKIHLPQEIPISSMGGVWKFSGTAEFYDC